jgi:large subunit ribosomal protein L22
MKDNYTFAKHMGARISPKKVGPVLDIIRNRTLLDAKIVLAFDKTKAAKLVLKVLKSAEANAKDSKKLDVKRLVVDEVHVGPGPTYKSGMIVAKSRFSPLKKRTSNIYIGLLAKEQKNGK